METTGPSDSISEVSLVPPFSTNLLATMQQGRWNHGVEIFGDKIVIFSGVKSPLFPAIKSVVMYDITKNECQELAPLPYRVSDMATVKWGDENVIIIGGSDNDCETFNKVLMYNVKTQKYHMLPNMKYARAACAAAVIKDTVIVMGGLDESATILKSVECFNFNRNGWEELPEMLEARFFTTAVVC